MTSQQLLLLIYLAPALMMSGMAFSTLAARVIGLSGLGLAILIGLILTIQHGPVHAHVPLPRYLPLVIIIFLNGVSLAIILVLRQYIQGFLKSKNTH